MDAEICSKIYGFTQLSDFKDFTIFLNQKVKAGVIFTA